MADTPPPSSEYKLPQNLDALAASEAGGVVDSIERHRTKILAAIALSAIALCAFLIIGQLNKQKHIDASEAFTTAATKGEIAGLDAILIEYPGSIPAGNALLAKAELQVDQGKSQDAQVTLERFVAEFKTHPRYPQGLFALANIFHLAGDVEKAKAQYEATIAAQPDGELTPLARIRLGDLALEAGDSKTADQFYQDSFTLHPGNPFFDFAQQKLALLKVGNPPEVDRPAPKPEPVPKKAPAPLTPPVAAPAPTAKSPAPASKPAPKPAAPTPAAKPPVTPPAAATPAPKPATPTPAAKPPVTPPAATTPAPVPPQ